MKGSKIKKMMAHEAVEFMTNDEIVRMLNAWNIVKYVESHMDKKREFFKDDVIDDDSVMLINYPERFFKRMLQDIAEHKTRLIIQQCQKLDPFLYKEQADIDRLYKERYEHYREKYEDRRAHMKATTDFIDSLRKAVIERSIGFTWGNKLSLGQEIETYFGIATVTSVRSNPDQNGMNGMCDLVMKKDGCKVRITWGGNIPHFYKMKEEKKRRPRMWKKGQPMFNAGDYVIYREYRGSANVYMDLLGKVIDITTDGRYVLAVRCYPTHMIADPADVHSLNLDINENPRFITYCKDIVYEDGQFIIAIPKQFHYSVTFEPTMIVFFDRSDFKNWCRGVPVSIERLTEWKTIATDEKGWSPLFNLTVYNMNDEQLGIFNEAINRKVQVGTEPGTVGELAMYLWNKEEPDSKDSDTQK